MRRVPTSTYRLQLSADFTFDDARVLLPYLADLGVGWVYLSPVLQATRGSSHGYDVVDPTRIDQERGGQDAFDALCREAHRHGLGVLVDIVPNHVGVADPDQNPWWSDVLEHGRDAVHASYFDIDWVAGDGRVLLPTLAEDADPEVHDHHALRPWPEEIDRLNYRRFFGVSSLAAVRVEDLDVFEAAHGQVRRWFAAGLVDGLRIDHPDGLRHPRGYLVTLADLTGGAYTVVEKILEPGEELPADWPADGTTGYEVLGLIDRILVDPDGAEQLAALDHSLRTDPRDWPDLLHDCKLEVTRLILASEVNRLARELRTAGVESDPVPALEELLACFPVYRSYLPEGLQHLEAAAAAARARRPELESALTEILPVLANPLEPAALRFQQTSGMVMAKGAEDRAFYRWSPLTSLDEVGGDPDTLAVAVEAFHRVLRERQLRCPDAMTTTSTHDTKRGEDVRARIDVLAEEPNRWTETLHALLEAVPVPDAGLGNLLWQAVIGCWPASEERLVGYAEKAMREAGEHTTWTEPDEAFENAVQRAVRAVFRDPDVGALVEQAAARIAEPGWSNALAGKLIALTAPGVPDLYQGSELWEQSLVDPDNRRPVDFDQRRHLLQQLEAAPPVAPARPTGLTDAGSAKLHVVRTALRLRRDHPELFTGYQPVTADGPAAGHVLAFDRGGAITVATRLPVGLARRGGWTGTRLSLPPGAWQDQLTRRPASEDLSELLSDLPVALLVREA